MKKKIILQRSYDYYYNVKLSLEQNLLDIKSMESNQSIHNVLKESSKATEKLMINVNDFESVAEKVRDNVDNMREVNDIIGGFNEEILNDDALEKELNDLQIAEDKKSKEKPQYVEEEKKLSSQEKLGISKLFPSVNNANNPNKNNILIKELNKGAAVNNKDDNKENFINNSFEEILEELNKK